MSILIDKNTRLVVQGITGSAGGFHAKAMMEYGTQVVAGVTPGKGGQLWEGRVPVFNSCDDAVRETKAIFGNFEADRNSSANLLE